MARVLSDATYLAGLAQDKEEEYQDSSRPVRSFMGGYEGLKSSLANTAAAYNRKIGDDLDAIEWERKADEASARAAGVRGAVPTLEEADSLGDYGTIAADWIFANAPLMGATLLGGPIGGTAARVGLGLAAKSAGKKLAASTLSKAGTAGQFTGSAIPYGGTTTGETYGRIRRDPDAEGTPEEQAGAAILSGAGQAALGLLPVHMLGKAVDTGQAFLPTLAKTALSEGLTETGESAISRFTHGQFNDNVNMLDADARREYIESFLAGAVVGGTYGGAGQLLGKAVGAGRKQEASELTPEQEAELNKILGMPQDAPRPGGTFEGMEGPLTLTPAAAQEARRQQQEEVAAAMEERGVAPDEHARELTNRNVLADLKRLNDTITSRPKAMEGGIPGLLRQVYEGAEVEDFSRGQQNMLADLAEEMFGITARTRASGRTPLYDYQRRYIDVFQKNGLGDQLDNPDVRRAVINQARTPHAETAPNIKKAAEDLNRLVSDMRRYSESDRGRPEWFARLRSTLNPDKDTTFFESDFDAEAARLAEAGILQRELEESETIPTEYLNNPTTERPFIRDTTDVWDIARQYERSDPESVYEPVSLLDSVMDGFSEQEMAMSKEEWVGYQARKLLETGRYDKYQEEALGDPEAFLDRFRVIRRSAKNIGNQTLEERALGITAHERKNAARGGRGAARPVMRNRATPEFPDQNRELPAKTTVTRVDEQGNETKTVEQTYIDLPNLTSLFLRKLTAAKVLDPNWTIDQRIAAALLTGLSALQTAKDMPVKINPGATPAERAKTIFDPEMKVWQNKEGRVLTWGEIISGVDERVAKVRSQLVAADAAVKSYQTQMDQLVENYEAWIPGATREAEAHKAEIATLEQALQSEPKGSPAAAAAQLEIGTRKERLTKLQEGARRAKANMRKLEADLNGQIEDQVRLQKDFNDRVRARGERLAKYRSLVQNRARDVSLRAQRETERESMAGFVDAGDRYSGTEATIREGDSATLYGYNEEGQPLYMGPEIGTVMGEDVVDAQAAEVRNMENRYGDPQGTEEVRELGGVERRFNFKDLSFEARDTLLIGPPGSKQRAMFDMMVPKNRKDGESQKRFRERVKAGKKRQQAYLEDLRALYDARNEELESGFGVAPPDEATDKTPEQIAAAKKAEELTQARSAFSNASMELHSLLLEMDIAHYNVSHTLQRLDALEADMEADMKAAQKPALVKRTKEVRPAQERTLRGQSRYGAQGRSEVIITAEVSPAEQETFEELTTQWEAAAEAAREAKEQYNELRAQYDLHREAAEAALQVLREQGAVEGMEEGVENIYDPDATKRWKRESTLESPNAQQQASKIEGIVQSFAGMLGIQMQVMTYAQAKEMLQYSLEGRARLKAMVEGTQKGFHYLDPDGNSFVWVDPRMSAGEIVVTTAHEIGHAVMHQALSSANPELRAKIDAEYAAWAEAHGRQATTVAEVLEARRSALWNERVGSENEATVGSLTEEQRQALLSFNEWFADQVGRWAETNAAPRSAIAQFFRGIAQQIKKIVDAVRGRAPVESVQEFMDSLVEAEQRAEFEGGFVGPQIPETFTDDMLRDAHAAGSFMQQWTLAGHPMTDSNVFWLSRALIRHMAPSEWKALMNAATGAVMQRRMMEVLDRSQHAKLQDPETAAAMMVALSRKGLIELGPQTKNRIERGFEAVAAWWDTALGQMTEAEQYEAIVDLVGENEFTQRAREMDTTAETYDRTLETESVIRTTPEAERDARDRAIRQINRLYEGMQGMYGKVMKTPYERMMDTNNPHLLEIARHLFYQSWDGENKAESFIEAKERAFTNFINQYRQVYKKLDIDIHDEAFRAEVMEVLLKPHLQGDARPEVKEAVKGIKKVLYRVYQYANNGGLAFPMREGYVPWIFNTEYLQENFDAFMQFATQEHFMGEWLSLQKAWLTEQERFYPMDRETGEVELPPDIATMGHPDNIRMFVENRVQGLISPEGIQESQTETGWSNPGFRFMNSRDLNFLQALGTEADQDTLAKFFEQDLNTTILKYVQSAAKRVEYARRFGRNGEALGDMMRRAHETGATEKEIDTAVDMVNAALGTHGRKTRDLLANIARDTGIGEQYFIDDGRVISDKLRNSMGWVLTYQNYRLLVTSVFSSFVDPFGTAVRTGDLGMAAVSMKDALKGIYQELKGDSNALMEMADLLGTAEHAMVNAEVIADYTGHQFTGVQKTLNDALFKYNGVEAVTRFSRIVATAAGERFLIKHKRLEGEHSARFLEELGLTAEDIVVAPGGKLRLHGYALRNRLADIAANPNVSQDRRDWAQQELDRDTRVRVAVRRFVDTSIIRPDAGKRPLWMSDAHFALIGHLKTFIHAFHNVILKRVGKEALAHGNFAPAAILALTFVPVMMVADWIRDMIKYGPEGATWKRDWTLQDYVMHGVKRAGLFGRDELTADVMEPGLSGDIPKMLSEALGPTASQVRQIAMYGVGERELPGQVLFRNWD